MHAAITSILICVLVAFGTAPFSIQAVKLHAQAVFPAACCLGADTVAKPIVNAPFSQQEIDMIAAVVMHEVGYCSQESKIAVTHVILNRLEDGRFGDSIYEVLHVDGQFDAVHNYYDRELPPDEDCLDAVLEALAGTDSTNGALYYCNLSNVTDQGALSWFATLKPTMELDGQTYFNEGDRE